MPLPQIAQSLLRPISIDWSKRPRRYLNTGELEALIALIGSVNPTHVLEIGVNEGRTAAAVLEYVPTIQQYVGIDVMPGYVTPLSIQRNEVPDQPGHLAAHDDRFHLITRPHGSRDIRAFDLVQFDAVFIDGDHSAAGVAHDTGLARASLRPGGIVVWHDYHTLGTVGVPTVLEQYSAQGDQIYHVAGTWLAFERR
jgi:predicted O-methyltransferase YrrM